MRRAPALRCPRRHWASARLRRNGIEPNAARGGGAEPIEVRELRFDASPVGPEKAVVLFPRSTGDANERLPLLVALHGRGESLRGIDAGAYGWLRDYDLGTSDGAARRARR